MDKTKFAERYLPIKMNDWEPAFTQTCTHGFVRDFPCGAMRQIQVMQALV